MEKEKFKNRHPLIFWLLIMLINLGVIFALYLMLDSTELAPVVNLLDGGSKDGWLGFWGSFLGSVVGLIGIFFAWYLQNNSEAMRDIKSVRPRFFRTYSYGVRSGVKVYVNKGDAFRASNNNGFSQGTQLANLINKNNSVKNLIKMIDFENHPMIEIMNVTNHDAYLCSIQINYQWNESGGNKVDTKETFAIPSIAAKEYVDLIPSVYFTENDSLKDIMLLGIEAIYVTEENENRSAIFKFEKNDNAEVASSPTYGDSEDSEVVDQFDNVPQFTDSFQFTGNAHNLVDDMTTETTTLKE